MSTIEVHEAANAAAWDEFAQRCTEPQEFLQSWQWGEFQKSTGQHTQRLEIVRGTQRVGVAQLVTHTTRLGKSFILAPRGPILDPQLSHHDQAEVWKALLNAVSNHRSRTSMFLKVEPNVAPKPGLGLEPGTAVHPEQTLIIDVTKSVEQLQADMHPKTRYNIGLAERKGVEVNSSRSREDLEEFLMLLQSTAQRQKIGIFPFDHYRTMVATLGTNIEVTLARFRSKAVAAALLIRFGKTITYVHGASADEHREAMASHLLHWQNIKRAKEAGVSTYDFFGVAPEGSLNHKWSGITRFKKGFGGTVHSYPGAFNLVYQRSWYRAYRLAKRLTGR